MSKHTPGPWEVSCGRVVGDFKQYGMHGSMQSDVCSLRERADGERTDADARLIAAAPELLELLKEYVRDFGDNEDADSQRMAAKARAALAKAGL